MLRWEVHLLGLLAKNPQSATSRELFEQFKDKLSRAGKQTAKEILDSSKGTTRNGGEETSAHVLLRRAAARYEVRRLGQTSQELRAD